MKLVFEKKDPQNIEVKIEDEGDVKEFDYIFMLKKLLDYGLLEESELKGDFSEAEKSSIKSMVANLNECVPTKEGQLDPDSQSGEE